MLAADHVVRDRAGLVELCKKAGEAAAEGYIVTLGVKPDSPATGYGYLRPGAPIHPGDEVLKLEAFVEKPDRAHGQRYIDAGYFWNSGNLHLPRRRDAGGDREFRALHRERADAAIDAAKMDLGFLVLDEAFALAPKKSIDYAVMEKTTRRR